MLRWLAEKRIQEAMDRGEFDNFEGFGQPFSEDFFTEQPFVPEEMKHLAMLYKGAKLLPYELQLKKEIHVLKVKTKSKKLSEKEKLELLKEISWKEIELAARLEASKS